MGYVACTNSYYFDVADDSRVCYVEKVFLSKVICKKLHDEVHWQEILLDVTNPTIVSYIKIVGFGTGYLTHKLLIFEHYSNIALV